ncbi:family 10 glycoside hydrolase [Melampsora americana]|nr:family 10 glycoside hydrolase [Melampsora americana]
MSSFLFKQIVLSVLLCSKIYAANTTCPQRPKIYLGTFLNYDFLQNEPKYGPTAKTYFNAVTVGNAMKWNAIEPSPGNFTFEHADTLVKFASDNCLEMRGHTMIWHQAVPSYLSTLSAEELTSALQVHITTYLNRYKDNIFALDVVNEIFEDSGEWRNSVWYKALGESYVELALQAARDAKTDVKLYLNDYNTEGVNAKSDALYKLAKKMKAKNLLDGVGFQSHFTVGKLPKSLKQNLQRFSDLGLDVPITELDIRVLMPATKSDMETEVSNYKTVVETCLSVDRCVGVTICGVGYKDSWIPSTFEGYGNAVLFDDNYNTTESYFTVTQALGYNQTV